MAGGCGVKGRRREGWRGETKLHGKGGETCVFYLQVRKSRHLISNLHLVMIYRYLLLASCQALAASPGRMMIGKKKKGRKERNNRITYCR